MITVQLFSFSKRTNSTLRPASNSVAAEYSCKLKEASAIETPQLEFNLSFSVLPQSYNYCRIVEFQRYYFITNWTYVGRIWVASCVVDVLATHRTEILASQQYVLRSASTFDGSITDTTYPLKNDYTTLVQSIPLNYASSLTTGTYIVGIINGDDSAMGCVSYYYMSQTQFNALKDYLLKPVSGTSLSAFLTELMNTVTDISEGAVKALFNPLQYIASCTWVPYKLYSDNPAQAVAVTNLSFGWWTLHGISAERIAAADFTPTQDFTLTISQHPQASARGVYLNCPPYTDYVLFMPPYGTVPLDGALCHKVDNHQIKIRQKIDLVTGNAVCVVYGTVSGSYVQLAPTMQASLALPIQLSQVSMNLAADWKTTAVAVGADSIAQMLGIDIDGNSTYKLPKNIPEYEKQTLTNPNSIVGAMDNINMWKHIVGQETSAEKTGKVVHNIASAAKATMTQLMSTGINGNLASLQVGAYLAQIFYTVVDDDLSHRGRPLCKKVTLSTLSGFTMIADPDLSLATTDGEIESIKTFMSGGMFIE